MNGDSLRKTAQPVGIYLVITLLLVAFSPSLSNNEEIEFLGEPCNGSSHNCEKSYIDVTYPETHNAHSTLDDGFNYLAANHRENISLQWDAGFRAFMMDVHHSRYSQDLVNTSFCHGSYDTGIHPCVHGSHDAVELLSQLHEKMNQSQNDVVTLLLEVYVPYGHVEYILEMSGLLEHAHVQNLNEEWPTIREMVDNRKNLVVFIEGAFDSEYPFLHSFTEHGWTTNYADRTPEGMNCDVLRGDSEQPVWHLNNWLALESGLTDFQRAPIVNAYDFLLNRSLDCWETHGSRPTFIAVDWWTEGEAVNVTLTLNQMNHWSDELPLRAATDSK
ncbi:MAG: hypothetical protein VYA86_01485 [Candidatus Thermoplasmatota archaeon]|nr:hypothetical protein [Candidatus Thermoplasmatota archaeon]